MGDTVHILGCRGSVPVSGSAFGRYGGATGCVLVRLGGQPVILDAGTGMLALPSVLENWEQALPVLLSHPHVDHLLGLPLCPMVLRQDMKFEIWGSTRQGRDVRNQLHRLLSPPLWPVGTDALPAAFSFHEISESFSLGAVQVETMEGVHPGGVTLFRLTGGEKSVVYMTDCNLQGQILTQAVAFARNCDLLLCDGQYSPEMWPYSKSFGHSTWEMAAELGQLCGAKTVRIIHHDPSHTDEILAFAENQLTRAYPNCAFAYEGERILL